ncbi:Uncharacterised protein [Serratia marcescens]|uniref:hypothetical protein n=1 Tax=Serratia marcescens TaxID=615 RepID=UPI0007450B55|nr:hypothetical protein [Serratia marcescens]CVD90770.1 Uncharacterised protein [Serratia marcescens]
MIPYRKVESLAACRMTEQQIADVLDIDLGELKREPGRLLYSARPFEKVGQKEKQKYGLRYTEKPKAEIREHFKNC